MPFKKTGKDTYKSPSGRKFTGRQVKAYYVTEGFARKPAKSKGKRKK